MSVFKIHSLRESSRGCGARQGGGFYGVSGAGGYPCKTLPIPFFQLLRGWEPSQTRGLSWLNTIYMGFCIDRKLQTPKDRKHKEVGGACSNVNACSECPVKRYLQLPRIGIDWVGVGFYPTAESFSREAHKQGISRRLNAKIDKKGKLNIGLKDFKLGRDYIALVHPRAVPYPSTKRTQIRRGIDWKKYKQVPKSPDLFGKLPMQYSDAFNAEGYKVEPSVVYEPGIIHVYKPEIEYIITGQESDDFLQNLHDQGVRLVRVLGEATNQTSIFSLKVDRPLPPMN